MCDKKPESKIFLQRKVRKIETNAFAKYFALVSFVYTLLWAWVSFVAIAVIVFVCRRFGFKHVYTITIKKNQNVCMYFYNLLLFTRSFKVHTVHYYRIMFLYFISSCSYISFSYIYTNIHTDPHTYTHALARSQPKLSKRTTNIWDVEIISSTERTEHTKCNCQISHYWATIQMISCVLFYQFPVFLVLV